MAQEVLAGRYRLHDRLGHTEMSEVWLAEDLELGRKVVVKLLAGGADPARFEREARAVAGLTHSNIRQLYDYGELEGRAYMVLEYLPGRTLEDRLAAGGPLRDEETVRILAELADGLAAAHSSGLVHRDLKPANVVFDEEGRAKIADFGIASIAGASTLTEAGTLLGTAAYISPEQAAGDRVTAASDVYSLGVIAYRMLTGRLPFESENAMELAQMHLELAPPPVAEVRPDAPPLLASVTMAALAKNPRERPPDGGSLLSELRGAPPSALAAAGAPTQIIESVRRPAAPLRRRRWLAAIATAAALLAGGVALALIVDWGHSSPPTTPNGPAARTRSARKATTRGATTAASVSVSTHAPRTTAPARTNRSATTHAASTAPPVTTVPPPPPSEPVITETIPTAPTVSVTAPTESTPSPPTTTGAPGG